MDIFVTIKTNKSIMKQKLFSLLLSASLVVFFACSDDESKPKSSFTVDGKSYSLTDGEYVVDVAAESTWFSLTLSGQDTKQYREVVLYFPVPGEQSTVPAGTFNSAEYAAVTAVDIESLEEQFDYSYPDEASVEVKKSGDTYTITFDLVFDGTHITGQYHGKLELMEEPK